MAVLSIALNKLSTARPPSEEQPRPAAGAAALARRHDEHLREPPVRPQRRPFEPACASRRPCAPGEVCLRREARRPRARGRRPQAPSTRTPATARRPPAADAAPHSVEGPRLRTVVRPERVGGVGVAPARRRAVSSLVVLWARASTFHRAAHGLGVGVVAAPIGRARFDARRRRRR